MNEFNPFEPTFIISTLLIIGALIFDSTRTFGAGFALLANFNFKCANESLECCLRWREIDLIQSEEILTGRRVLFERLLELAYFSDDEQINDSDHFEYLLSKHRRFPFRHVKTNWKKIATLPNTRERQTFHPTIELISCYFHEYLHQLRSSYYANECYFLSERRKYWKQWKWFGTNSKFETSFTFFIVFITNFFVEIFGIKRSKEIPNRLNEIHRWIYFGSIVIKFGNLTRWRSRPRSHRTCGASTAMGSSSCSSSNSSSSPCWKDYIEYLIMETERDILDYHSNHDLLV